jgi:hypothetical protein
MNMLLECALFRNLSFGSIRYILALFNQVKKQEFERIISEKKALSSSLKAVLSTKAPRRGFEPRT